MTLWRASVAVLAVLPVIVTIAHRSAPLVLTVSAALALAALWRERGFTEFVRGLAAASVSPLGLAVLGFLALAGLSVAWSPVPPDSLFAWGEFVLPLGASFVLARTLPDRAPPSALILLGLSVAAAASLILLELATGQEARHALGMRWSSFIFNRPALTLLVLIPPLAWALFRVGQPWIGVAAVMLAAVAILRSDSGAAGFGLAAAALAYLIARLSARGAIAIAAAAFVLAFALAPISGELLHRLVPSSLHRTLSSTNSQARVDIWRSFGAAVRVNPVLGTGFAPGSDFAASATGARVDPSYRTFLAVGHPHNAALQVWAELGAVGAALALAILLLTLRSLAGSPPQELAPRLALMTAASAVSLVGHGVWQGWWPAVIGAAIVWFLIGARLPRRTT